MPRLGLVSSLTGGAPSQEAAFSDSYSLDFDGTDDYVNIPQGGTAFPSGDAPRTISLWIKRASAGNAASGSEALFKYGWIRTNEMFALVLWTNSKNLYFTGYGNDHDTGIDIDDTDWHHLVVTFDGTTVIVYKDGGTAAGGEQDSSTAGGGNWTNLDTNIDDPTDYGGFLIGMRDTYYGVEFVGKINDVAIWDVELSAADVVAIYNSGAPNDLTDSGSYDTDRTGDLVGYWKFEEGSGSTATDSSGKGYDGTISGDTSYSTDVPS
tara:strand:- start:135 stop:929 length:795 start_codon:yes stop_codon:yes gene_type:complete